MNSATFRQLNLRLVYERYPQGFGAFNSDLSVELRRDGARIPTPEERLFETEVENDCHTVRDGISWRFRGLRAPGVKAPRSPSYFWHSANDSRTADPGGGLSWVAEAGKPPPLLRRDSGKWHPR